MKHEEIMQRAAILTRLWSAYPSAGRCSEAMLVEYVNATRGLTPEDLERCVDGAIARGGEFLPSAGDVVRRAVEHKLGGPPAGEDKGDWFHFRAEVKKRLEDISQRNQAVPPLRQIKSAGDALALRRLEAGLRQEGISDA